MMVKVARTAAKNKCENTGGSVEAIEFLYLPRLPDFTAGP